MDILKLIVPLSLGLVLQAEGIINNPNPYQYKRAFNNIGPPFDVVDRRRIPFFGPTARLHDDVSGPNIPIQDGNYESGNINESTDLAGKRSVLDSAKDKNLKDVTDSNEQQAFTTIPAFKTTNTQVGYADESDLGFKGDTKTISVPQLNAEDKEHKNKSSEPSNNASENDDKIIFTEESMEILPNMSITNTQKITNVSSNSQSIKYSENDEFVTVKTNYSKAIENITAFDKKVAPVNLDGTSENDVKVPDMNSRFGLEEADFILVPIGTVHEPNNPDGSTANRGIVNNRRTGPDTYVPQKAPAGTNSNYLRSDDRIYFPENVAQPQYVNQAVQNQNYLLPQAVSSYQSDNKLQNMSPQQTSVIPSNQVLATSIPVVGQVIQNNLLQSSNMPGLGNGIFHENSNGQGNFMQTIPTNQQANMFPSNNPYYPINNNQLYTIVNVPNNFNNGQSQNFHANQLMSYPNINYNQLLSNSQPLQNTNTYQNQLIYSNQPSQNTNIFPYQPVYGNQPMGNIGIPTYPNQHNYDNQPIQNSNWYPNQLMQSNLQNQNTYGNQPIKPPTNIYSNQPLYTLPNQNPQFSNVNNPGYNLVSPGNYPNNNVPTDNVGNQLSGNHDAVTFPQNRNIVAAQNPNNVGIPFATHQMLLAVNNG